MIRLVGSAWPSGCHTESLLDDKSHLISSTRVPDLAVAQPMNRASKTRVILAAPFRRRAPAALAIRASSGAAVGSSRRHYLVRRKRRLRLQTNCRCSIRRPDCLAVWCLLGEDTRRVGHVVAAKCRPIVSRTMAPYVSRRLPSTRRARGTPDVGTSVEMIRHPASSSGWIGLRRELSLSTRRSPSRDPVVPAPPVQYTRRNDCSDRSTPRTQRALSLRIGPQVQTLLSSERRRKSGRRPGQSRSGKATGSIVPGSQLDAETRAYPSNGSALESNLDSWLRAALAHAT